MRGSQFYMVHFGSKRTIFTSTDGAAFVEPPGTGLGVKLWWERAGLGSKRAPVPKQQGGKWHKRFRKKQGHRIQREEFISLQIHFKTSLGWIALLWTLHLFMSPYLNNLRGRSRAHHIAMGLLFPVGCLVSFKDHSAKAYTAVDLKG